MTTVERLWRRSYIDDAGCWLWRGSMLHWGYGKIKIDGVTRLVHRVSWFVHNGPIPDGLCVCHKCDNPSCWNPAHLFIGTQLDNMRDKINKGRAVYVKGMLNCSSKLSNESIAAMRVMASSGINQRAIASLYDVNPSTVCRVVRRKSWAHL